MSKVKNPFKKYLPATRRETDCCLKGAGAHNSSYYPSWFRIGFRKDGRNRFNGIRLCLKLRIQ